MRQLSGLVLGEACSKSQAAGPSLGCLPGPFSPPAHSGSLVSLPSASLDPGAVPLSALRPGLTRPVASPQPRPWRGDDLQKDAKGVLAATL